MGRERQSTDKAQEEVEESTRETENTSYPQELRESRRGRHSQSSYQGENHTPTLMGISHPDGEPGESMGWLSLAGTWRISTGLKAEEAAFAKV